MYAEKIKSTIAGTESSLHCLRFATFKPQHNVNSLGIRLMALSNAHFPRAEKFTGKLLKGARDDFLGPDFKDEKL